MTHAHELSTPRSLFLELRCEELPARFVQIAEKGVLDAVLGLLAGIPHGEVRTWASPRRIALEIVDLAGARPRETQLVTGPPEAACFKDGKPTQAAIGFAKGKGVPVESLTIVDGAKGRVIAAEVSRGGEKARDLLVDGLEKAILGIGFSHTMTWGPARWARPIHGLVVLHGDELLPCSIAGIQAGTTTLGHRLHPQPVTLDGAASYRDRLAAAFVLADRAERRAEIESQLSRASSELGLTVGELKLVDEVVDLVEWPQVVICTFSEDLLDLPPRLLVESMGVNQRVFPLYRDGVLTNRFLAISNHPQANQDAECAATIAAGNAKVLGARFHDARFFYAEDRKKSLELHGERLHKMQWIRGAGSMAEKSARIAEIAGHLAEPLGASPHVARRAGALAKADLATQMVGEFPELQGHVGRLLAGFDGESPEVALAIEEHYLPRFAYDSLPSSPAGRAVALADRLDTLIHTFRLGLKPKGSADPLGLRRAANGVLALVLDSGLRIELPALVSLAAGGSLSPEITADLVHFVLERARASLGERHATDVVNAVLATGDHDLVALSARCEALTRLGQEPHFEALKTTFKRIMNISKDHVGGSFIREHLQEPAEFALADAFTAVRDVAQQAEAAGDYGAALAAMASIQSPVDSFFEAVLVMAPEPALREARLSLLSGIAGELRRLADLRLLN
jgi:glycyl-tRNA synthetase beta chain